MANWKRPLKEQLCCFGLPSLQLAGGNEAVKEEYLQYSQCSGHGWSWRLLIYTCMLSGKVFGNLMSCVDKKTN